MQTQQNLTRKEFEIRLCEILAGATYESLCEVIRAMALQVEPANREKFLTSISINNSQHRPGVDATETLLSDLKNIIHTMNEAAPVIDWDAGYMHDDGESAGPLGEFIEPLTALARRVDRVFDSGNESVACECYKILFEAFDITNEYEHHINTYDLGGTDEAFERRARFLRSILTATTNEKWCKALYEAMLKLSQTWGRRASLNQVIEVSSRPFDLGGFLPAWIEYLGRQDSAAARSLRREAVFMLNNETEVKKYIAADGKNDPRWFYDWVLRLTVDKRWNDLRTEVVTAFEILPTNTPIVSAIAKLGIAAARELDDRELILECAWRAFKAKPSAEALIFLVESTTLDERSEMLERAHDCIVAREYETKEEIKIEDLLKEYGRRWEIDQLENHAHFDSSLLVHSLLLNGKDKDAFDLVKREKELGWSYDNPQAFFVAHILAKSSPKILDEKKAVGALWKWALEKTLHCPFEAGAGNSNGLNLFERYVTAYRDLYRESDPSDKSLLNWSIEQSEKRINGIMAGKHRSAYDRAALLVVACSQALDALGRKSESVGFFATIGSRYSRFPAFQSELKAARSTYNF